MCIEFGKHILSVTHYVVPFVNMVYKVCTYDERKLPICNLCLPSVQTHKHKTFSLEFNLQFNL